MPNKAEFNPEWLEILATKDDIQKSEQKMNARFDEILGVLDTIVKDNQKYDTELAANQEAHKRMQKQINENRVKLGLETAGAA